MSGITFRQLTIFSQIVEQGSFNRCASFLGVSNVAITSHIKKLEEGLGHKLFQRSPGNVAILTEDGKRDYQLIIKILSDLSLLLDESKRQLKRRTLNITIEPFIYQCMQDQIKQFGLLHPEVDFEFELEDVSNLDIEKQLKVNSIDFGYFYAAEDFFNADSEFVCHVPLSIYVGKGHSLANKKNVCIKDLLEFEVLKTSKNNYLNKLFSRAMEEIGLVGLSVAMETDNMSIFGTSLDANKVFTCMNQWVEATEYGARIKRLNLDPGLPNLQLRQVIRPPLNHDPLIQEASELFTASLPC